MLNEELVNLEKLSLNFQQIDEIDRNIPDRYLNVKKLFLTHNHLQTLKNLEQFENIQQLSISYNELLDLEELTYLQNPEKLQSIAIRGNFMEKHPNSKMLIMNYFEK